MRHLPLLSAITLLLAARAAIAADPYKAAPGPYAVATLEADWKDAARDATVPIKIYYPKNIADLKDSLPLIIFSHGLGGSREGYQLWGEHWASQGYIVIHPTHVGSDTSALATGLAAAITPENAVRRVKDVSFIIDQMEKANAGALAPNLAPFKGKIDLHHIGMAGHSFGAQTTLSIAGELVKVGRTESTGRDPRITAAIAMSPQAAILTPQPVAFGSIKIPLLHITGTADDSPPGLGNTKAADRRIPYDNSPFPDTYLLIFQGATHMTFAPTSSGATLGARLRAARNPSTNSPAEESTIHTLVKESTTAFWDAYLKDDPKAKRWLQTDFFTLLGSMGTFETKTLSKK